MPKDLVFFLFKNFVFTENLFLDFLVISIRSFDFLLIHISISFQLLNEAPILGRVPLIISNLILKLVHARLNRLLELFCLLLLNLDIPNTLRNGIGNLRQLFGLLLLNLELCCEFLHLPILLLPEPLEAIDNIIHFFGFVPFDVDILQEFLFELPLLLLINLIEV